MRDETAATERDRATVTDRFIESLRKLAIGAAAHAYAPYSKFPVGAAVLTSDGQVFSGCNVENSSYGLTICAERNAIFQAVAKGHASVQALVIAGGSGIPVPPCGACLQVINEFGPDALVVSFSNDGTTARWRLKELLPAAFGPMNLQENASRRISRSAAAEQK